MSRVTSVLAGIALLTFAGPLSAQEVPTQRWRATVGTSEVALIEYQRAGSGFGYELRITTASEGTRVVPLDPGAYPQVWVWSGIRIGVIIGDIVSIVDIASARRMDWFYGRSIQVSPDGRFLAYTLRRTAAVPEPPEICLLYDLAASPAANRMADATELTTGRAAYPEWYRQFQTYEASPSELTISMFSKWLDSTHLVLADCAIELPAQNAASLRIAVVNVAAGLGAMDVRGAALPVSDVVDAAKVPPGHFPELHVVIDDIVAEQITPSGYVLRVKFAERDAVTSAAERQIVF